MSLILTALARELQTTISSAALDVTLNSNTLPSLGEQLNQILLIKHLPDPARHEVDEAATDLWNACSQAMGTFAGNENNMNVLSRGLWSYQVLSTKLGSVAKYFDSENVGFWSCGNHSIGQFIRYAMIQTHAGGFLAHYTDHLRALKAALAAAGSCIGTSSSGCMHLVTILINYADTKELMIGLTVLEAAARRLEALKTPSLPIAQIELNSIVIEYYSHRLRIV